MNVQVFDADAKKFVPDQTVLVDQGKITAVGAVGDHAARPRT